MSLTVVRPGMQATLQGAPRPHYRHQGVPSSGPADELSHHLANIAVGNTLNATAIEITAGGFEVVFEKDATFALSGAPCPARLNTQTISFYAPIHAKIGDRLTLEPAHQGFRSYLAISGSFIAKSFLDSTSTYIPARLGGHDGRALISGDRIKFAETPLISRPKIIPEAIRPFFSDHWLLRFSKGPEFDLLSTESQTTCCHESFKAGRRLSRMGIQLENQILTLNSDGRMKSEPVFSGTIQCPENGKPFILLADAQTTGGYPRIGQVISCDRHRLGQIKPGDKVKLVLTSPDEAQKLLKERIEYITTSLN